MAMNLPSFPSFDVHADGNVGPRWTKWLSRFQRLLVALDIDEDARMRAMLLHYAGPSVDEIFDTLDDTGSDDDYDKAKLRLTEYFTPKVNTAFELYNFRNARQLESENIDAFCTRLRQLAKSCGFTDVEKEIAAQIILSCSSQRLRRKGLRDNLSLKDLLNAGKAFELSEIQANDVERSDSKSDVNTVSRGRSRNRQGGSRNHAKSKYRNSSKNRGEKNHSDQQNSQNTSQKKNCYYCGGDYPHSGKCPARGKKCGACGVLNHFARVCRNKQKGDGGSDRVQYVGNDGVDTDDEYLYTVGNDMFINTAMSHNRMPVKNINISGENVPVIIDSGASVDILDQRTWDTLKRSGVVNKLKDTQRNLFAYGSDVPLPVIGVVTLPVSHDDVQIQCDFHVIRGNSGNLLSFKSAEDLQLLTVARNIKTEQVMDEFPNLFDGIGKIKNKQVRLHVDDTVQPTRQPHRRIPFHVRKDVEDELKRLEDMDIIEKVDGPTPWVSPIVVVPKKSGGARLCVDMREANFAIKREKHIMPTLDDLISDLNGSRVFSKLDLTAGYHQLELHPDSRYLTTFSTHVGLRRYKRLSFGINTASEIFQNAISEIIQDIPHSRNISDDILVHGKTQAEHDATLRQVLVTLRDSGVTLNKSKCEFSKSEITFYGHVFGEKGLSPDPEKIKTIINTKPPTNSSEVKSLLGMAQYVARFIPNYATITEPLRKLTRNETPWKWEKAEVQAFERLKAALSSTKVMDYFDPQKKIDLFVDASPVGVGAILTQEGKILSYASRALSDTEMRYSQTEREMLAVVWAAEHFHLYTYGESFTILTDHKPLLGVFKSRKYTSARIERWRIRLTPYRYELVYRPGKDENNPADYVSRHPVGKATQNIGEDYINYVCSNAVPKALSIEAIQQATKKDPILQEVIHAIETGNWKNRGLELYSRLKEELAVHNGIVLRSHRIVVPGSLREQAVELAHVGHQGILKTKRLLREKVWFPGIDQMVEDKVKTCIPCQAVTNVPKSREPLRMTNLPSEPWKDVSVDMTGPFPSGDYMIVVIDDYSRYPEVEIVQSTSARAVIPKLDAIFARHGIPQNVKTDNGSPFNSKDFKDFAEYLGFHHRRVTPLWPEANGEVERFMRSLKKCVQTATAERLNWKQELWKFLRQYRATPHCTTDISPYEAMTGRKMSTQLPDPQSSIYKPNQKMHENLRRRDEEKKLKMKEYADNRRHTKYSNLAEGDTVLVRQPRHNKLTSRYDPRPYTVTEAKGSMLTARRGQHKITRNSSHFKPINVGVDHSNSEEEENETELVSMGSNDSSCTGVETNSGSNNTPKSCLKPADPVRRSAREKQLPVRFKDYALNQVFEFDC